MRKILLSFLGTNNYLECNYYLENDPSQKIEHVKYIQEALVRLFCKDFTADDQVLLFLTEKAETMNFWDDGQLDPKTKGFNLPNVGLRKRLEQLNSEGFHLQINHQRIKEGFSQEEVWSIFETVADEIHEGDQVIIDITHAFRFLPMLGIVLLNYLKVTKNINVLGIHYGAFEKLGSFQEIKEMEISDRNAPIIDLKTLLEFQSWTSAVSSFVNFGAVKELRETSHPKLTSILTDSRGGDEGAKNIRYVIEQLSTMTSNLQTNRLNTLVETDFTLFQKKLHDLQDSQVAVKPFKQILKLIEKKANPIITAKELIWLESAKWCLEHKLVQQAYTQLQEGLLSYSMQAIGKKLSHDVDLNNLFQEHNGPVVPEIGNITHRLFFSSLLYFVYRTAQNKINEDDSLDLIKLSKSLQSDFFISLGTVYAHITEPRNDINHAGLRNDPMKADALQKRIGQLIQEVEELLK